MPASIDLIGQRFGKLLVIGLHPIRNPDGSKLWICRCDCGNEKHIRPCNLGYNTNSCGCIRNTQGAHSRKHPLWKRWSSMLDRCENPTSKDFANYGGRGIKVSERWKSFPLFLEDMEATYFDGATLERKDNNGYYGPENVRWATAMEQCWNKRKTVFIETPWGRMSRGEAAKRAGIDIGIFNSRVRKGWSMSRLFDPSNRGKMHRWSRKRVSP